MLPGLIRKRIPRNPVHPRLERIARRIRVPVPEHPHKHVMHQILRHGLLTRQPEEEPEQTPVPSRVQFAHTVQVAARDCRHQFVVSLLQISLPASPSKSCKLRLPEKVTE